MKVELLTGEKGKPRAEHLDKLKEQVRSGIYHVDPAAIAEKKVTDTISHLSNVARKR